MTDFNIESYIFDTLTGVGTLFGKDDVVRNPLTTPYSKSEKLSDTQLEIFSDDGNESSYGFDIWEFLPTHDLVKLVKSYGRDMFEGNISDSYPNIEPPFLVIGIDEFDAMFKNHIQNWEYRTGNPIDDE